MRCRPALITLSSAITICMECLVVAILEACAVLGQSEKCITSFESSVKTIVGWDIFNNEFRLTAGNSIFYSATERNASVLEILVLFPMKSGVRVHTTLPSTATPCGGAAYDLRTPNTYNV